MGRPGRFHTCLLREGGFTDVFIAGTGEDAVLMLQSKLILPVPRRLILSMGRQMYPFVQKCHYVTRHQICGKNVPWYMTNTSEPHADDMLVRRIRYLLTGWSKECVD